MWQSIVRNADPTPCCTREPLLQSVLHTLPASRPAQAESVLDCVANTEASLERALIAGMWADGVPIGRGHSSPYLKLKYAEKIIDGLKTHEGRPGGGWIGPGGSKLAPNDYIRFKIAGTGAQHNLCVRVLDVQAFSSFEEMVVAIGVEALLPGEHLDVGGAVDVYQRLGNHRGSFGELEEEWGAVAVHIHPCTFRNRTSLLGLSSRGLGEDLRRAPLRAPLQVVQLPADVMSIIDEIHECCTWTTCSRDELRAAEGGSAAS